MLTYLQYWLLQRVAPIEPGHMTGAVYEGKSKVRMLLGERLIEQIQGKTIIDFGCGEGLESLDLARSGAGRVIGVDIREDALERARTRAREQGLDKVCHFALSTDEKADAIISLDAFEHFEDPAAMLKIMHGLLRPAGFIAASFGPTWFHPYGGHMVSVFPWAHLIFSEKALMRWRAQFRSDGATCYREVEGGLNKITIDRFERIVAGSQFTLEHIEPVPIRKLKPVHTRLTREFTTAIVRCKLTKKP